MGDHATTIAKLPYPDPTSPVWKGAANIGELAAALDPRLSAGLIIQTPGTSYPTATTQVGFSSTPLARGCSGSGAGLIVATAGWWDVTYYVGWAGGAATTWVRAIASINGSGIASTDRRDNLSANTNAGLALPAYPMLLAAGDTVGLQLQTSVATATALGVWLALRYRATAT